MNFIRGYSYINQKINLIRRPQISPRKIDLGVFSPTRNGNWESCPYFFKRPLPYRCKELQSYG